MEQAEPFHRFWAAVEQAVKFRPFGKRKDGMKARNVAAVEARRNIQCGRLQGHADVIVVGRLDGHDVLQNVKR
jgi:hypothetical protein